MHPRLAELVDYATAQRTALMAAACAGAKQVRNSLTLGILPGADGAGSDVDIAVFTAMGDARNAINVLTSDVVVACGVEGPGTASEVSLALKAGKPVILLAAAQAARVFFESLASIITDLDVGHHATSPASWQVPFSGWFYRTTLRDRPSHTSSNASTASD